MAREGRERPGGVEPHDADVGARPVAREHEGDGRIAVRATQPSADAGTKRSSRLRFGVGVDEAGAGVDRDHLSDRW